MSIRIGFAIGTGRCGTHFLHNLMAAERGVRSHHERHPLSDAYQRYCQWYRLPVDHAGFLEQKRQGIEEDLKQRPLSFEASAYLSLSVRLLYERVGARFVFLVRHPHDVIMSMHKKGLYEAHLYRDNVKLAPGIQPGQEQDHHSFSRITPHGAAEALRWHDYTRIGKLAWFWRALNEAVFEELEHIPSSEALVVRLEDLDYKRYGEIAHFLGIRSTVGERQFIKFQRTKKSSLRPDYSIEQWSEQSVAEYREEVASMAQRLDYRL